MNHYFKPDLYYPRVVDLNLIEIMKEFENMFRALKKNRRTTLNLKIFDTWSRVEI